MTKIERLTDEYANHMSNKSLCSPVTCVETKEKSLVIFKAEITENITNIYEARHRGICSLCQVLNSPAGCLPAVLLSSVIAVDFFYYQMTLRH
jgi:hypothetical protein